MAEGQRAEPIRWSEDGMVCYIEGKAFGINEEALTVYLGTAEEVMKAHPLSRQRRKPLELKLSRHNRFRKGEISKSDRGR